MLETMLSPTQYEYTQSKAEVPTGTRASKKAEVPTGTRASKKAEVPARRRFDAGLELVAGGRG